MIAHILLIATWQALFVLIILGALKSASSSGQTRFVSYFLRAIAGPIRWLARASFSLVALALSILAWFGRGTVVPFAALAAVALLLTTWTDYEARPDLHVGAVQVFAVTAVLTIFFLSATSFVLALPLVGAMAMFECLTLAAVRALRAQRNLTWWGARVAALSCDDELADVERLRRFEWILIALLLGLGGAAALSAASSTGR